MTQEDLAPLRPVVETQKKRMIKVRNTKNKVENGYVQSVCVCVSDIRHVIVGVL